MVLNMGKMLSLNIGGNLMVKMITNIFSCPNCKGKNIDIWKTGEFKSYVCKKCGHRWNNSMGKWK